jgi:hypothetical protein
MASHEKPGPPVNPHLLAADPRRCIRTKSAAPTGCSVNGQDLIARTLDLDSSATGQSPKPSSDCYHQAHPARPALSASPTGRVTSDYGYPTLHSSLSRAPTTQLDPFCAATGCGCRLLPSSPSSPSSPPSPPSSSAHLCAARRRTTGRPNIHCFRAAPTHPAA